MRTICIIDDGHPIWREVRGLLTFANARIVNASAKSVGDPYRIGQPDLIILSSDSFALLHPRLEELPLLILTEGLPKGGIIHEREGLVIGGWPIEETEFLRTTAQLLKVPRRRPFAAMMHFSPSGVRIPLMGISRDFSLTGLSFESQNKLTAGDSVTVSFSIPYVKGGILFDAEIVRCFVDPKNGAPCYGAKFLGLTPEIRKILTRFVLNA